MNIKIILFFFTLICKAISRTVVFKVISFGSKTYVNIVGGNKYEMKPINTDDILHTINVSNVPNEAFEYNYIVDDEEENFIRTLNPNIYTTYNEFYGRKDTVKKLKTFNHPPNLSNWNRSIGKTKLFDDTYIPTLHITGENVENFFHDPNTYENTNLENVKFYLKNSVETFSNVPASAKNRGFSRFQFQLWLDNDILGSKGINGRYVFKLRTGSEDPLNLRQLIYGNIIQTIGMPSLHSIMVRVYYNKKPVGFYTLQESVITYSFIQAEFYGDPSTETINPPKALGFVLDGTTGSDFEYRPEDPNYYAVFDVKPNENRDKLVSLTKAINELNTENELELAEFESKWFDIDTFHKAMAMEYLTGDWDGYWYTTGNFAVYDDPTQSTNSTYKFYFITQDHDETFGVGLWEAINKVGKKFPELSYTTMINRKWHIIDDDAEHRVLVDKFISSTPKLQKRFEKTLLSIVVNIFNPVSFREVVDTYYERYQPEVKWDYSFTRPYVVENQIPNFGYEDFIKNFEVGLDGLNWGLYEWVELRAESIKREFCITWKGDKNPPLNCNNEFGIPINPTEFTPTPQSGINETKSTSITTPIPQYYVNETKNTSTTTPISNPYIEETNNLTTTPIYTPAKIGESPILSTVTSNVVSYTKTNDINTIMTTTIINISTTPLSDITKIKTDSMTPTTSNLLIATINNAINTLSYDKATPIIESTIDSYNLNSSGSDKRISYQKIYYYLSVFLINIALYFIL
ncbi:hypothetical protein H8356DRAFT_1653789 [Neocallimastix lanati (nom. inval.)]|jgi:hypothetical protein|uniref:Coth-domain-containing protein n=1 Tax=Neocallimastix californiae TaxID=1754190 RepID=A0A1Y2ANM4_9FUNG|nr:hypothetical protein H8356DRAFT_1653789 [Neocallimastix sp. JGI-2020a]ORY24084.1 hypothetical protein LY90DRAFT_675317 [Neocallimastix californiae]|eukprot:ORY24084.1 hypothetical protein LY90DRAFT_675317 [Neocallimastix californiae]